jgi:Domain of unknown function (DUF397)
MMEDSGRASERKPQMTDDKFAAWRKSSYSGDGNSCVEVAVTRPGSRPGAAPLIGVRDTKRNGRGPVLAFDASAWQEFLSRIR